ncbi:MAG: indole-3-glycerol phosphate synthase TrpC, partial [Solirubrobacterales bacterium]
MNRLDELLKAARRGVDRRRARTSREDLYTQLGTRTGYRPFKEALIRPGLSVIAEFKRGSPSAGQISGDAVVAEIVDAYERGGASAISVLTEESSFGGSLDDLRDAREASRLPILCKDFIVDPYQLLEAAVAGADACLLIVAGLADEDLRVLTQEATLLDIDCLIEVHDQDDLERALDLDVEVIGINNRNLGTLEVDITTTEELITDVPAGKTVVAESGYRTAEELSELVRIGIDAVLIGETLMRSSDPAVTLAELTEPLGGP